MSALAAKAPSRCPDSGSRAQSCAATCRTHGSRLCHTGLLCDTLTGPPTVLPLPHQLPAAAAALASSFTPRLPFARSCSPTSQPAPGRSPPAAAAAAAAEQLVCAAVGSHADTGPAGGAAQVIGRGEARRWCVNDRSHGHWICSGLQLLAPYSTDLHYRRHLSPLLPRPALPAAVERAMRECDRKHYVDSGIPAAYAYQVLAALGWRSRLASTLYCRRQLDEPHNGPLTSCAAGLTPAHRLPRDHLCAPHARHLL